MRISLLATGLSAVLSVGCADHSLTIANSAPEVTLLAPSEGTSFAVGADVVFRVRVRDGQNPLEDLDVSWSTDRVTTLVGQTVPGEDDELTFTVDGGTFPAGAHLVSVTATDPFNASDADNVRIFVAQNVPPTIAFAMPASDALIRAGDPVPVRVQVTDPDEPRVTDLIVRWTGPGSASLPTTPDGSGVVMGELTALPPGPVSLTADVFDTVGGTASATVSFVLFDPADDSDNDGYRDTNVGGDDCNDDDPTIHPGAVEVCDGVDQDCNDLIDDDPADADTWYVDSDQDGYGAPGSGVQACSQPDEATADNALDCDDTRSTVHPAADEVPYNGIDDDCVGGDQCNVDGDAFTAIECGGIDCDDTNADVFPGQTEVPYNGLDDDCAGDDDCDIDGDGFDAALGLCGGSDCDDNDPTRFSAGPITVPTEAPTIQAAVDALCIDGRVDVLAGTYVETVNLGARDIDVVGVGRGLVIVDGGFAGPVFTMSRGSLTGMTLTHGSAPIGGGVLITGGVRAELTDLLITANTAQQYGGGVAIVDATSTVTLTDVLIDDNRTTSTSSSSGGGGLYIDNSPVSLQSVTLTDNITRGVGGGLRMAPTSAPLSANDLVITGNSAMDQGGLSVRDATLTDVVVSENIATSALGAGRITDSDVTGLVARDNETGGSSQSTLVFEGSTVSTVIRDVVYEGNSGEWRGLVFEGNEVVAERIVARDNQHPWAVALVRGADVEHIAVVGNSDVGVYMGVGGGTEQRLSHALVVGNGGAGVQIGAQSNLSLIDTIIAYNDGTGIARNPTSDAQPDHTLLFGNGSTANFQVDGDSVLLVDPEFTDTSGSDPNAWDLTLQPTSPAIGAGSDGSDLGTDP